MLIEFENELVKIEEKENRVCDNKKRCYFENLIFDSSEMTIMDFHRHEWLEIIHVIEGEVLVNSIDNIHLLKKNDIYFIGSGQLHQLIIQKNKTCLKTFYLNIGFIMNYVKSDIFSKSSLKMINKDICNILKDIENTISYSEDVKACRFLGSVLLLLGLIGEEVKCLRMIKKANTNSKTFSNILHFINLNYDQSMSLSQLSDLFGYTPQYMSSLFKKNVGKTFYEHLISLRLAKAKYLLVSSDKKIIDIAYECGFESERSLTNMFKNFHGQTPSNYRKKLNVLNERTE